MTSHTSLLTSAAIVSIVVGVIGLAGCALTDGSGATVLQSRTALYAAADTLQTLLGGEWENRDDPTPRGCTIPIWADGVLYPALRVGGAPGDVDAAVAAVENLWTELGLSSARTTVGSAIELQTRTPIGELLVVRVSDEAMTINGESECRPKP
jgi:hypothetical protein